MRSVFGDESHDKKRERVFTVAGVLGDDQDWDELADKWTKRTGGRVFHAADCESDRGDFAPANEAERDAVHKANQNLYKDLTTLLAETRMLGHAVSLDLRAYRECFRDTGDPSEPYYFCFHGVIAQLAADNSVLIPLDKLKFTFEHNFDAQYNAAQLYNYMLHLPEWSGKDLMAEEVTYAFRKNPKIQVADLVAREAMKRLDNRIGPKHRRVRLSMAALMSTRRFRFVEIDQRYLRDLIRRVSTAKGLPSADKAKWRQWLNENGLMENTSNLIRWHYHNLSQLQDLVRASREDKAHDR